MPSNWNQSWQQVINPFDGIRSSVQLFDACRSSLAELLRAAAGRPQLSQDEFIALLAGPKQNSPAGEQVRQELANKIRSVLDAQHLVSLDALLTLGEGLNQMAQRKDLSARLIPLAGELREFQMPKPLFSSGERAEWAYGLYRNPHIQIEIETDLTKIIKSGASPRDRAMARGQLVPFLRDTLVGLNYACYEPPDAQMLLNNPLFVRAHDFSGDSSGIINKREDQAWHTPHLEGRGNAAGGGAHLAGSLAGLPYVLAEMEQNFIVPENVQSLIWEDLVPSLLVSAAQGVLLVALIVLIILNRWIRLRRSAKLHPRRLELDAVMRRWTLSQAGADDVLRALSRLPVSLAIDALVNWSARVAGERWQELSHALEHPWWARVVRANCRSARWWQRLECARFLSVAATQRDIGRVLRLLRDHHPAVQIAAATTLERLTRPVLVTAALEQLPFLRPTGPAYSPSVLKRARPAVLRHLQQLFRRLDDPRLPRIIEFAGRLQEPVLREPFTTLATHPDPRDMARLILGLSPQALAEYAA